MNAGIARFVLAPTIVIAAFNLPGCSRSQHGSSARQASISSDVAPGTVLIDILEAGHPEHYCQYEVQPTTGIVRIIKETTFPDYSHEDMPRTFQEPAGAIGACEGSSNLTATSPDGTYSARCTSANSADALQVNSGARVAEWKTHGRGIRGFAWAPNSNSIAILNVSSYYGKSPLELLAALSGHPVPHDKVLLDIFDVQTGQTTEYLVRNNVVSSFTRILRWAR